MDSEFEYQQLISSFPLDPNLYKNITRHTGDSIGFSFYRLPSQQLKETLGIDNSNDYRTLIAVYFNKSLPRSGYFQPINIRMSFCLYNNNEYFLDYSVIKNKKALPIDIYHHGLITCDLQTAQIYNQHLELINGKDFIEELYKQHIKMAKRSVRLWFRIRHISYKAVPISFLSALYNLLNITLTFFTGDSLKQQIIKIKFFDFQNTTHDNEQKSEKPIDFYGLKVKPVPLFTYSLCHLIGYFVLNHINYHPSFIKHILEYNLLTVVYVIFSYIIYTKIPEIIIKPFLMRVDSLRSTLIRKKIEP